MKILVIAGSHPRHEYILRDLIRGYSDVEFEIIIMQREALVPNFPIKDINPSSSQQKLFYHHFKLREELEKKHFGVNNLDSHSKLPNVNIFKIQPSDLNSGLVISHLRKTAADVCIVMGAGMLKQETLDLLPQETFNIHLGLSPKYRGSATLFWPTFLMDPFSTGITFHRINLQPDAGEIIHQSLPVFERFFTLHETAIAAINSAKNDLSKLFNQVLKQISLKSVPQPVVGKTFLTTDFRIAHLETIYNFYNDQVLDYMWPQNSDLVLPTIRTPNMEI